MSWGGTGRKAAETQNAMESDSIAINVARGGLEPPTFHFSGERYYQLSYLAG